MSETQEVGLVVLAQELANLRSQFEEFKKDAEAHARIASKLQRHVDDFQSAVSSRRGLPGQKGDVGPAGRDAVLVIKTDTTNNVVRIFDESGTEKAAIVAVPGPKGDRGDSIVGPASTVPGPVGRPGKDGVSPNVDEIVAKVVAVIASRLK